MSTELLKEKREKERKKCFYLLQFKKRELNCVIIWIKHFLQVVTVAGIKQDHGGGFRDYIPEWSTAIKDV